MNVNFPENLTDDFLGLFVGITGMGVLAAVVFVSETDLANLALGAIITSVGVVLNGFIKKGPNGSSEG